uniref:Disintegrin and metalloproteinase domain-containing protein 9-like n=1 Tax=Geotrypetes seraphini TaxID=260995 RepID=A0A6P8RAP7_GEOSA|nr:disintegrin and metalloproteinase domain-containing protein 9-like [Geotrypetes seraphini]
MSKPQVPLTWLCFAMLMTMLSSTGHALTLKTDFYEVTIPRKLEPKDGREIEGHMSYAIIIEGRKYVVHLIQNRAIISPNFTLITYTDEGDLLVEQPYIRNDCYYQGYVEGIKHSIVALSTCSGLRGFLQTKTLNYGIQPLETSHIFQHLVYRMNDLDFENNTCGVKSEDLSSPLFAGTTEESKAVIKKKRRYVELALVVDYERYVHSKENTSVVQREMVQIVHQADAILNEVNTDLVLLGIEIWTQASLINITYENPEPVLTEFRDWASPNLRNRLHYDDACLVL